MSKAKDLQQIQQTMQAIGMSDAAGQLISAVGKALDVPGPVGSPDTIRDRAKAYSQTAKAYTKASTDLGKIAADKLPSAWTGAVAEHATQAVQALANELTVSQQAMQQACNLLSDWATDLEHALHDDAFGVVLLKNAMKSAPWGSAAALNDALDGVKYRLLGAQTAERSATKTASKLNQLATKARAERVGGKFDPLAALVLANEKGPGGEADGDYVLTDTQLHAPTSSWPVCPLRARPPSRACCPEPSRPRRPPISGRRSLPDTR
ncbi:WXG100-like domain-containing protein [Kitasatospora sp. NPDC001159]